MPLRTSVFGYIEPFTYHLCRRMDQLVDTDAVQCCVDSVPGGQQYSFRGSNAGFTPVFRR
jgi:hypothetical protein